MKIINIFYRLVLLKAVLATGDNTGKTTIPYLRGGTIQELGYVDGDEQVYRSKYQVVAEESEGYFKVAWRLFEDLYDPTGTFVRYMWTELVQLVRMVPRTIPARDQSVDCLFNVSTPSSLL